MSFKATHSKGRVEVKVIKVVLLRRESSSTHASKRRTSQEGLSRRRQRRDADKASCLHHVFFSVSQKELRSLPSRRSAPPQR